MNQKEEQQIDQLFKNRLEGFEKTPAPDNWDKLRSRLPLHPMLKSHLLNLSKVAAVLLIGIIISLFWQQQIQQNHTAIVLKETQEEKTAPSTQPTITETNHVIDLPDETIADEAVKEILQEETALNIDDMLLALMEDDEDLFSDIDQEVIQQALQPLNQLPIEGLAMLPKKQSPIAQLAETEKVDLKIMIPLRVMSKQELKSLQRRYAP